MTQTHFTPKQLAERLRISEYTLASWRCKGERPKFMKFGKAVRYLVESVCEWEIGKTRTNTSQCVGGHKVWTRLYWGSVV